MAKMKLRAIYVKKINFMKDSTSVHVCHVLANSKINNVTAESTNSGNPNVTFCLYYRTMQNNTKIKLVTVVLQMLFIHMNIKFAA